jgi:hypothetical protein
MVALPQEQHRNEQYFFDRDTRDFLVGILCAYDNPCLLGVPTVANEMPGVRLLDIDDRFADHNGFVKWDMHRPEPRDEDFDVIVVDPPFRTVSYSQLFDALRILTKGNFQTEILLTGLARREHDLLSTFYPFGIKTTGVQARYVSVQNQDSHTRIMFYSNFALGE